MDPQRCHGCHRLDTASARGMVSLAKDGTTIDQNTRMRVKDGTKRRPMCKECGKVFGGGVGA